MTSYLITCFRLLQLLLVQTEMSGGGGSKSPRGPLPTFGGPPSKSNYMCKICEKEIRRDKIKEHYGPHGDLGALNKPIQTREQAL